MSTDASVGAVGAANGRGVRRWRVLLAVTVASAFLFSLSTSERAGAYSSYPTVCSNGVIVYNTPCPYVPPTNYKTQPLKGAMVGANHQTVFCPPGGVVSRVTFYADAVNLRAGGVQLYCKNLSSGVESAAAPVLGRSSSYAVNTACPAGSPLGMGIVGKSSEVVYRWGLRCTDSFGSVFVASAASPQAGWDYGTASGPFDCAAATYMVGLTAEFAPFSSGQMFYGGQGYNITALWADCHAGYNLTNYYEVAPPSIGAAAPPTVAAKRYRASSSRGAVALKLMASHATTGAWYYAVDKLALPAGCGRVPGAFVANRRKRSEHARFHVSRSAFRVKGYVFGALAKPKVHATVTVKKGACSGEAISFTARPS